MAPQMGIGRQEVGVGGTSIHDQSPLFASGIHTPAIRLVTAGPRTRHLPKEAATAAVPLQISLPTLLKYWVEGMFLLVFAVASGKSMHALPWFGPSFRDTQVCIPLHGKTYVLACLTLPTGWYANPLLYPTLSFTSTPHTATSRTHEAGPRALPKSKCQYPKHARFSGCGWPDKPQMGKVGKWHALCSCRMHRSSPLHIGGRVNWVRFALVAVPRAKQQIEFSGVK